MCARIVQIMRHDEATKKRLCMLSRYLSSTRQMENNAVAPRRNLSGDEGLVLEGVAPRVENDFWARQDCLLHIAIEIMEIDKTLDGAQID